MQDPQIQFYKGSLVRLASGKLKQVQDLRSEDFLESNINQLQTTTVVVRDFHHQPQSQTLLIKFFIESSRSAALIQVPVEHPFFVLHRGWSSWNPQRTYEKFRLKCRKLKIGDTCISLARSR